MRSCGDNPRWIDENTSESVAEDEEAEPCMRDRNLKRETCVVYTLRDFLTLVLNLLAAVIIFVSLVGIRAALSVELDVLEHMCAVFQRLADA